MAKVLFVHGMRMQNHSGAALTQRWYNALAGGLRETRWGRTHPERLPSRSEVGLVFWGDLFRPRAGNEAPAEGPAKGPEGALLLSGYYAVLRGLVRSADELSLWDAAGGPRGPMAALVNRLVYQSAVYMNNGPLPNPDPGLDHGAFVQIQARFERALAPETRVVIAHSLGTVIAYEGLCLNPHSVETLITVGSPLATLHLILEPLRQRMYRFLRHSPDLPLPWPNVRRWLNIYAKADVWCVPVERLAPLFRPDDRVLDDGAIQDIEVSHGNPHDFERTHRLTTYLEHPELLDQIACALDPEWPGWSTGESRSPVP
jgi:pimeloyl-ACP methyl ester carboxylesterase